MGTESFNTSLLAWYSKEAGGYGSTIELWPINVKVLTQTVCHGPGKVGVGLWVGFIYRKEADPVRSSVRNHVTHRESKIKVMVTFSRSHLFDVGVK